MTWKERWPEISLLLASVVFVGLQAWSFAPRFSDGGIYAYLGQAAWGGKIPYLDFFYSSPPLLPYLFGLIGIVFNWHWWGWQWLPMALSVVDAWLIYWLGQRLWSRAAGVIAAVSYLFSFLVLATANFPTDVHFVLTLALWAAVAQQRQRYYLSGVLFALAGLTKVYAVVLIVPLVGWLLWKRHWVAVLQTSAALVGSVGVVAGILYFLTGPAFYQSIITHNLGRGQGIPKERLLQFLVTHDPWLLLGFLLPLAVRRWPRHGRGWVPAFIVLPIAAVVIFVIGYPDMYYLYFKLLAPWLALLLGWGAFELYREYGRSALAVMLGLMLTASLVGAVRYIREQAQVAVVDTFAGIVAYVEEITKPTDALYGNFEITPLVAVESRRRIFRDLADTNVKFYFNDTVKFVDRLQALVDNRVPVMIGKAVVDNSGAVQGYEETWPREFINRYCRVGRIFPIARDYTHTAVVVWRCSY